MSFENSINQPTYKTVILKKYGSAPANWELQAIHHLPLQSYQVRIRIKAFSISYFDYKMCNGATEMINFLKLPLIPGHSISGIVEEVGTGVFQYKKDDEVVALVPLGNGGDSPSGGYSEYIILDSCLLLPKPKSITHEKIAGGLLPTLLAYIGCFFTLHLSEGEFVLVLGGRDGIDNIVCQVAQRIGAKIIMMSKGGYTTSLVNESIVRVIDYQNDNFLSAVLEETGIFDCSVGKGEGLSCDLMIGCLAVHGRIVTINSNLNLEPMDSMQLYWRGAQLGYLNIQSYLLSPSHFSEYLYEFKEVIAKIAEGSFVIPIEDIQPLDGLNNLNTILNIHSQLSANPNHIYVVTI